MTPQFTIHLLRTLFVVFSGYLGFLIGGSLGQAAGGTLVGTVFGLSVVLADRLLHGISLRVFSSATFGLLMGTIFAKLLLSSDFLRMTDENVRWTIGLAVYAACAYFGTMLAIRSNREEFSLIIPYVRVQQTSVQEAPLVVDSNIIIDGRLPELCETGFISRSLVVPRFILHELQKLADSGDPLRRERGKRALDQLQRMQKNALLSVIIHESEADHNTIDARLVQVAKLLQARLLTNDGNLCALARLQGVTALNLHELAQALRPSLSTGDELQIVPTKEGKEAHQAVGYLPDGTMIVVNHARPYIGQAVMVTISTSLQTSAGRMFFAELKS